MSRETENAVLLLVGISVALITARPPPCGVGVLCEERAFGLANA